jgi:hypothetical protein
MNLLRALAPLIREAEILYLTWARAELDPLHRDLPAVVRRLNELQRKRPKPAEPSALCCMRPDCQDTHCEGADIARYFEHEGAHTIHFRPLPRVEQDRLLSRLLVARFFFIVVVAVLAAAAQVFA